MSADVATALTETVTAYFHEFAEARWVRASSVPEASGTLTLSFHRWCCFLTHSRLFSSAFDHSHAVDIFFRAGRADPRSEAIADLDLKGFRTALEHLATTLHKSVRESTSATQAALKQFFFDVNLRRESSFDGEQVVEAQALLYNIEVVRAVYTYSNALRSIFAHYATNGHGDHPPEGLTWGALVVADEGEWMVGGRSAFRVCLSTHLVPESMVPGELVDLACNYAGVTARSSATRSFFEDEEVYTMLMEGCGGNDAGASLPLQGLLPGEPRYDFPGLVGMIVAAVLYAPPTIHTESASEKVRRIHEVFSGVLDLPAGNTPADALPDGLHSWDAFADWYLRGRFASVGEDAATEQVLDASGIFARLEEELPALPDPPEFRLPQPPPGAKLRSPPPTVEEIQAAKKALQGLAGKKKRLAKAAAVRPVDRPGPQDWGKVCFYDKTPAPKPRVPAAALDSMDRRADQWELFDSDLQDRVKRARSLAGPVTGTVLRMALIDEPLMAPPCQECEEVTTLIETALTSRRLRNHDVSIALLIRARELWAAMVSDLDLPPAWDGVQAWMEVSSPWGVATGGALAASSCALDELDDMASSRAGAPSPYPDDSLRSFDCTIHPSDLRGATRDDSDTAPIRCASSRADARAAQESRASGARSAASAARSCTTLGLDRGIQPSDLQRAPSAGRRTSRGSGCAVSSSDTFSGAFKRRYDPSTDFASALGDGDENIDGLLSEVNLFFLSELASLHTAIKEDDLALQLLWRARIFADRLPANHPDTAVVWCGLGRVAFCGGQFDLAARVLGRARRIRERTIGGDTVETATTYNNLACCFQALERHREAFAYSELAVEILKELAGDSHPRTQTAVRNLEKARSTNINVKMEETYLFSIPVKDTARARRRSKKGSAGKKVRTLSRSNSARRRR